MDVAQVKVLLHVTLAFLRQTFEGPFTLSINVCIFENNRSNANKMQMQRMGSITIFCVDINITIDTILKFDANINTDAQYERTLT